MKLSIDGARTRQRFPNPLEGERGALLLAMVIVMTLMGVMAAGVYQFTRNTSFSELFSNNTSRAYYIAESGGLLAVPQVKADPVAATNNLNGKIFSLTNGTNGKFQLAIDNSNASYTLIYSTGTVSEGSWFEAKRQIIYKILKTISDPFNYAGKDEFLKNWDIKSGDVSPAGFNKTGPNDNDAALNLKEAGGSDKSKTALVGMNWTGAESTFPNLLDIWTQNNGLLSYEIQVKVKVEAQGQKSDHYMEGLSFRLNTKNTVPTTDDSMYGISFFRSKGRVDAASHDKAPWVGTLPSSFDPIMTDAPYIVFWKKVDGIISLIDYKTLSTADGIIASSPVEILPWSTLVVKVAERYKTDADGNRIPDGATWLRENLVTAYFQGTSTYPRGTIKWDYSIFQPVAWLSHTQPVVDESLTTKNFDTIMPNEIGIHAYYDSNAANDQFFDDFAFRRTGSGGGGTGDIQYY